MTRLSMIGIALATAATCTAAVVVARPAVGPAGGPLSAPLSAPPSCPQHWGGDAPGDWVPGAADVDGAGESLVPGEPVAVTICAYPGDNTRPGGELLAGSRPLTSGAGAMARDLGYLPVSAVKHAEPCTMMGGAMTNYLLRFAYPDGKSLWVGSAEEVNSCVTTTNGTVSTPSYVGQEIAAAYRTGKWEPVRPGDPCQERPTGRRGQDRRMVPDGPVSVLVCEKTSPRTGEPTRREHDGRTAEDLAEALNSLAARPSDNTCQEIEGMRNRSFRLLFRYADGPPADVWIFTGCVPGADNGLLQANLSDSLRARLRATSFEVGTGTP
ncbi:hypothetical protein [Streptosporangium sp. NPDC051022]|uniref:hypothetical protein n=1 Tax=Streptosporangium sp. NPDC051022 TaxID=3155752 RepID=UPI003424E640